MLEIVKHRIVPWLKRRVYSGRGEPYRIGGRTLRYVPGTRPVRLRYKNSVNSNVRFDALQIELLSAELKAGSTVIDVGAHCGQYTILMAALCGPAGHVIAFEPDPDARAILQRNLNLNPSTGSPRVEPLALSDVDGDAVLYTRGGNSQSSLARSAVEFEPGHHATEVHVATMTLDTYLHQNSLPIPDWIKIDAEGAEVRILKGATKILTGCSKIICELHPYAWPEFGNTFAELKELLSRAGRQMRYLGSEEDMPESPQYGTILIDRA